MDWMSSQSGGEARLGAVVLITADVYRALSVYGPG